MAARILSRCAVCMLLAALPAQRARAGALTLGNSDTGNFILHQVSFAEMPFRTVVRQQFDYSCGSAALATLLRYHYGRDASEATVFQAMYAAGDQARIQKLGFSLLDMKTYLAASGYQADGYRLSLDNLAKAATPAIALIQVGSYKHFVVIKGVIGDSVLVGDPAQGLRKFSREDFLKSWNGIAFLLHDAPGANPPVFNGAEDWQRWSDSHPLAASVTMQPMSPLLRDLRMIYQIRPFQNLN
ncbi:MAG TPA: C39 family peptidase [Rhizomicrobium sp.]|nr:C39 family peptidase [Rhizomicrobium sp.]